MPREAWVCRTACTHSRASSTMPPTRCSVTMAGKSFMVTVQAPNAPCRQTHTSVAVGHQGCTAMRSCAASGPARRWRRHCHHAPTVSAMMSTPTAEAR